LIFAFLGDGEAPEFPSYPEFERFAGLLEIDSYLRRCNYFQNIDNALDMSHVAFTHGNNRAAFDKIGLGRNLQAEESDWGVTYTFTRDDGEKRIHQFGMPNVLHITALPTDPEIGWQESLFWWVPIDDTSHVQFSIHRVPATGETARACTSGAGPPLAHRHSSPGCLRHDPERAIESGRLRPESCRSGAPAGRRGSARAGSGRGPQPRASGPCRRRRDRGPASLAP
jgi:phenylpropionate dioxygenase-like ring-hydroxylating dioxygenase large terminal subunit